MANTGRTDTSNIQLNLLVYYRTHCNKLVAYLIKETVRGPHTYFITERSVINPLTLTNTFGVHRQSAEPGRDSVECCQEGVGQALRSHSWRHQAQQRVHGEVPGTHPTSARSSQQQVSRIVLPESDPQWHGRTTRVKPHRAYVVTGKNTPAS